MSDSKYMPDFLLEAMFNVMIDLTNKDHLKWNIDAAEKRIVYYTTDNKIRLYNYLNNSYNSASTLKIEYNTACSNYECYVLNNLTYPRGENKSYNIHIWDKLYYNLVTAIIQNILRHGSDKYDIINYLASVQNPLVGVQDV